MAELSRFFGIIIYMLGEDHNPPHIHAKYNETTVSVELKTDEVTGDVSAFGYKNIARVLTWVDLHRTELLGMWESQNFIKLEPLK